MCYQDEKIFIIILVNIVIYMKNVKFRILLLIIGVYDENCNCNSCFGVSQCFFVGDGGIGIV